MASKAHALPLPLPVIDAEPHRTTAHAPRGRSWTDRWGDPEQGPGRAVAIRDVLARRGR